MDIFKTSSRAEWRKYLEENFTKLNEIWFSLPVPSSNEEGVSYNDAVEEALCFGWIDSTNYPLDENHRRLRFSPRRKSSAYSQLNIERLIWLNEHNLIHESILPSVLPIINKPFKYPKKIINALKKEEVVWNNYQNFSDSYKRIRIAHIVSSKSKEEYEKRLKTFINKTRDNKLIIGNGSDEKYYK